MDRVVRDGKVAVLYSPKFGAGWYSWNRDRVDMLFDPGLVDLVLEGNTEKILVYVTLRWPGAYTGGLDDLAIEWIPVGSRFIIEEHDGAETVKLQKTIKWIRA
jgi:hypothetical protein